MTLTTEQALENAARTESFGHLGYAYGFEYFTVNGEVYRAPYENPMGTEGYRQGARWESRSLSGSIVDALSDREGNPIPQPEDRFQIRKSVSLGWYVTDTMGFGPMSRPGKAGEFIFRTRKGAENFRNSLKAGKGRN